MRDGWFFEPLVRFCRPLRDRFPSAEEPVAKNSHVLRGVLPLRKLLAFMDGFHLIGGITLLVLITKKIQA